MLARRSVVERRRPTLVGPGMCVMPIDQDFELDSIASPGFWQSVSAEDTQRTPLAVVLPSGCAEESHAGHLALVSDSLYVPEIVIGIDRLSRSAGLEGADVVSMLDIDFKDVLLTVQEPADGVPMPDPSSGPSVLDRNLLVLGSARINLVSKLLLEKCESFERFGAGFMPPYDHCVVFSGNKVQMVDQDVGVMAVFENPWSRGALRCAMFCGGVFATGTMSANLLLSQYLRGEQKGNGTISQGPLKIVSGRPRSYVTPLHRRNAFRRAHMDMVNIERELEVNE